MERTSIEILQYIKEMLAEEGVQPSQLKGRILFMSMYNDNNWWQNENEHVCRQNLVRVASLAKGFESVRWSRLGLGTKKSGTEA